MDSKFMTTEDDMTSKTMDLCDEIGSRKRKAVDSEEIETGGLGDMVDVGDGKESDVSSREEGQEWDVDSFDDGHVYKPKRNLDPNDESGQKWHRYRSQMYRSKGFQVDSENVPRSSMYRHLGPIYLDEPFMNTGLTGLQYTHNMVDLALERYNRIKGFTVTCEYIKRALTDLANGFKSYITFMAKESPDGDLVEYQAKTEKRIWQKNTHVIFCRPAPEPKELKDDEIVYETTSSEEVDSDLSSRGSGQDWDVDSLDGESEYKPPRIMYTPVAEMEKMRLFRPNMHKSKGFKVDGECYSGLMCYFTPVDLDKDFRPTGLTGREYMTNMADLALDKYNEIKGTSVTCEEIVRANLTKVDGIKSYITFKAREVPDGDLVDYQAKTERKFCQRRAHAILCRPVNLKIDI